MKEKKKWSMIPNKSTCVLSKIFEKMLIILQGSLIDMRVYEFSKQYNIPAKDVISALRAEGFDIKSHMSIIDEQAVTFLKKKFKNNSKPSKSTISKQSTDSPRTDDSHAKSPTKQHFHENKEKASQEAAEVSPEKVIIQEMSVAHFAHDTNVPVSDIILTLLRMGVVAPKNKILSEDVVRSLVKHYGFEAIAVEPALEAEKTNRAPAGIDQEERLPIVVVLGHVDHGKTTLLDFIRKTRVASREKGGITQHIGAYEATTDHGNIVFLDTPGHEAFSKIRKRGVHIADLVILIVAADDGVMPQTVEAIKHALAMKVPIVVAINKMDKVDPARVDVIKRELSQHGIIPEEWGGTAVCIPISAKTGKGVSELLEMIALQAQLMELKAARTGLAQGFVLESGLEKGYGQVATVIIQHGVVRVGDFFSAGNTVGKVSVIVDSHGNRLKEAGPSIPVRIVGFESLPNAGDDFECVSKSNYLIRRSDRGDKQSFAYHGIKKEGGFNFILKTDTNSSKEALIDSIAHLSRKTDKGINMVLAGVGGITESDVELAYNTGARIIGLHVKVEPNAILLAQHREIPIHLFDIIYKLLESVEAWTKKKVVTKKAYTRVGEATVLRVFDIKGVGVIAGSYVKEGRFAVGGRVNVLRHNKKVGEGVIKSLQRDKKSVKEVHTGFECGFVVEGFNDWEPNDTVECFVEMPS